MAFLKWTFILAAAVYFALTAAMFFAQRKLLYFPDTQRVPPAAAGFPQAEEVVLDTDDGEKIVAWHLAPQGDKPVVVYFHGNGGTLPLRVDRFRRIAAAGVGLVAIDYRGYGGSTGSPSERGLIEDARAAYAFAAARYPGRIVLWGESLGTGVAVALAAEKPATHLVLDAPYTSTLEVAANVYWYLPVRFLMKDTFRSDLRIANVKAPVLILHGDIDDIVPIRYGEKLFAMIGGEKRFVRYPGGYHVDLDRFGATEEALKFIGAK